MRRDARQARVERALRAETAFRRAMEDSLATGLAVIRPPRRDPPRQRSVLPDDRLAGDRPRWTRRTVAVLAVGTARRAPDGTEGAAGRQSAGQRIRAQGAAPRRIAVRCAALRLATAFRRRRATRLDDGDGRHHRTQAHQRRTGGRTRALHHRAAVTGRCRISGRAGCSCWRR